MNRLILLAVLFTGLAFAQDHQPTVAELQGALGVAQQQLARSNQDALALGAQLGAAQAEIAALKAKCEGKP